jgi:hypothetical protein
MLSDQLLQIAFYIKLLFKCNYNLLQYMLQQTNKFTEEMQFATSVTLRLQNTTVKYLDSGKWQMYFLIHISC